jgi:hypothetical protein
MYTPLSIAETSPLGALDPTARIPKRKQQGLFDEWI